MTRAPLRCSLAVACLLGLGATLCAREAHALDFKIKNRPLRLDITESMFASIRLDTGTPDPTDKNYGEILNRLNLGLAYGQWLVSARFDTAGYIEVPKEGDRSPYHYEGTDADGNPVLRSCRDDVAGAGRLPDATCLVQAQDFRLNDRFRAPGLVVRRRVFGRDLGAREADGSPAGVPLGVTPFYVEKAAIQYSGRSVEATLGDFYANIGRGLILSIRKVDELGVDTTITGAKVLVHEGDFNALVLAGFTNVQNVDQLRAQWIEDPNDFITAAHFDYRLLKKFLVGANLLYGLPTRDAGGRQNGAMGRDWDYVLRPGFQIDAPRILPWLGMYLEYARREDCEGGAEVCAKEKSEARDAGRPSKNQGDAVYASASITSKIATWLVEFKHYSNYRPMRSSENPFGTLVYMQPPTLEQIITQIANNTDITAARLRLDVRVDPRLLLFISGQAGRSLPEGSVEHTLVDVYGGAQIRWDDGRSHFFPQLGLRTELSAPLEGPSTAPRELYERLVSLQWDFSQLLPKSISIETQGLVWVRQKQQPSIDPDREYLCRAVYDSPQAVRPGEVLMPGERGRCVDHRWSEGNIYLALRWAPRLVASVGFEWTTLAKEQLNTHHFINGSLLWNITSSTSLLFFAGGNRPGLRCISGVCRDFPAFQGVRLELVVRL